MTTRFEIAKAIGGGAAGLFKRGAQPQEKPAFPQLANALYYQSLKTTLAPPPAGAGTGRLAAGMECAVPVVAGTDAPLGEAPCNAAP
jgi:hypothetical protein